MSSQFRASLYMAMSWSVERDWFRVTTRYVVTRQITSASPTAKSSFLLRRPSGQGERQNGSAA